MRAYGHGDAFAFEALYARHKAATYRYFLRHLGGDAATADELHQDLWLKVIGARERYEANAKFSTWLYTLARHRMVDHWRSRHGVTLASLEDEATATQAEESASASRDRSDDPLDATIDAQARRRLVAALAEVPKLQRDAFLLHIEGGLSLRGGRQPHVRHRRDGKEPVALRVPPTARGARGPDMSNHDREIPPSQDQDAALTRAWKQASDEQPAPELDAAIIAAARKSVPKHGARVSALQASPRSPSRLVRWQPLAAAATVAGLAFILVQLMPRDRDVVPSIRMEEPVPGPADAQKGPDSDRAEIEVPTQQASAPAGDCSERPRQKKQKQVLSAPTAAAPSLPAGAPDDRGRGA